MRACVCVCTKSRIYFYKKKIIHYSAAGWAFLYKKKHKRKHINNINSIIANMGIYLTRYLLLESAVRRYFASARALTHWARYAKHMWVCVYSRVCLHTIFFVLIYKWSTKYISTNIFVFYRARHRSKVLYIYMYFVFCKARSVAEFTLGKIRLKTLLYISHQNILHWN